MNGTTDKQMIAVDGQTFDHRFLIKVANLDLSVRSTNCLEMDNIVYVGDLVQMFPAEMLRIPSFGRKCLREVQTILALMELKTGMEIDNWPAKDDPLRSKLAEAANTIEAEWIAQLAGKQILNRKQLAIVQSYLRAQEEANRSQRWPLLPPEKIRLAEQIDKKIRTAFIEAGMEVDKTGQFSRPFERDLARLISAATQASKSKRIKL